MTYSEAAKALSLLIFPLLRLLEFTASWIVVSRSFDEKMDLGDLAGRLSSGIRQLAECYSLLSLEPLQPVSSLQDEARLISLLDGPLSQQSQQRLNQLVQEAAVRIDELCALLVTDEMPSLFVPTVMGLKDAGNSLNGYVTSAGNPGLRPGQDVVEVAYSAKLPIPAIGDTPGRPDCVSRAVDKFLPKPPSELAKSKEGMLDLLFFFFVDIEIAAAEVCAANIVLFRDAPLEFRLDMARQVWDESRHARAVLARIHALGGDVSGRQYSRIVWDRWWLAKTLPEKIAVEQIIQEGNGVDASPDLANVFRINGDELSARMIEAFMMDECLHAGFGNKWMLALTGNSLDAYREAVYQASALIQVDVPGRSPVHELARLHAGFPLEIVREFMEKKAAAGRP